MPVPLLCGVLLVASAEWSRGPLSAHEVITTELTWTRNVSRIVHLRCATCHRAGGGAPMPLTTYEEVRPWAKAIKHEVLTRRMPPWGAVKGYGAFRNDASLPLPEIALLSSWVEGGAPEGSEAFLEPFHDHDHSAPQGEPAAGRMAVRGTVVLESEIVAAGVSPGPPPSGGWLQLAAHRPDGGVEPLIWLREPLSVVETDYWFLRPVRLPAGTRLVCEPDTASVDLWVLGAAPAGK